MAKKDFPLDSAIPAVFDSMAQCASQTGIPIAVLKRAKRDGCDAFKSNRVYLRQLLRWVFNKDEDRDWKSEYAKWHALREQIFHDRDAGLIIDFATIRYFLSEMIAGHLFGELERMRGQMPAALQGMTQVQMFEQIGKEIDGLKSGLRARLEKMMGKEDPLG